MNKDHLEPIKNMVTRSKYNNTQVLIINNSPSRKGKYFPFIPPINMMVTKLDKLKGISKKNDIKIGQVKGGKTSKPRHPCRVERFSEIEGNKRFLMASTVVGRFHRRSNGCRPSWDTAI